MPPLTWPFSGVFLFKYMDEKYIENLLRFIGATNYTHLIFLASQQMYNRPFYQLGPEERNAVSMAVNAQIGANTAGLTPELLRGWLNQQDQANKGPLGFQAQQSVAPKQH